jgi:hypothetical protein
LHSFFPQREELLLSVVAPLLPEICRVPKTIDWIRSHLTRAYLECIYGQLANVHLVCDQVEWYLQGKFPCGWSVLSEEAFPHEAKTIVF